MAEEVFSKTGLDDQSAPAHKGANYLRRNALGRGLSALMSATAVSVVPKKEEALRRWEDTVGEIAENSDPDKALIYLPLDRLSPSLAQPRRDFNEQDLNALAQSIKSSGMLQPIIVRRKRGEMGSEAGFEIVAGERRWRAAKTAGLDRVPVIVRELGDREAFALGIVENVQRADLNPIEEAQAYKRLIDEFGETQQSIASMIGKDRVSVTNLIRLLSLDEFVRSLVAAGKISAGHGRALLMLQDTGAQQLLAKRIIEESLSVRAAEKMASAGATLAGRKRERTRRSQQDPSVSALEERIRRALGTKVSISLNEAGAGEVKINFYSRAELENFLEKVGA